MNTPRLIRATDLELLGEDPHQLAARSNRGELVRLRRGIYVKSRDWVSLDARSRYGLRATAFQRLAGSEPVFCHATAALLWGLWIVGVPKKLHVITESTSGGRSRNNVTRHIGSLRSGVVQCGSLLVTDKLTTTMGLIRTLSFPYAVAVCDSSLHQARRRNPGNRFIPLDHPECFPNDPVWSNDDPQGQPLALADLVAAAELLPGRATRNRAAAVIAFSSGLSGSAGESLSRVKMHELGVPAPQLQRRFMLRDGNNAFVDFWFEEQRLAGEFDGLGKYLRADWADGKSLQDRIIAEKQREDQIRAQGAGFVRWTWAEMMDRQRFKQLLRQAGILQK